MKRILSLSVLVALAASVLFLACPKQAKDATIGCITELTGDKAAYGRQTKQGVDLAVAELNASGGILGRKVAVLYEDDLSSQQGGIAGFTKLVSVNRVPAVIGGCTSPVTVAIAPKAEAAHVVLLSACSTADTIKYAGDYIFRIVSTNAAQGKVMAELASSKLGAKTAAIIYGNNDYAKTLKDGVQEFFTQRGGRIVSVESYEPKTTDFRTQLVKTAAQHPDVIFFPGFYQESGLILKQAREMGLRQPFIGGDGAVGPELIQIAGVAAENSYYANLSMGYGVTDAEVSHFVDAFKQRYGEEPTSNSAYAYDALRVLADAVRRGGYTSEGIKRALYQTVGFRGASGVTSFDSYGEVDKPFYIYAAKQGKFELYR